MPLRTGSSTLPHLHHFFTGGSRFSAISHKEARLQPRFSFSRRCNAKEARLQPRTHFGFVRG